MKRILSILLTAAVLYQAGGIVFAEPVEEDPAEGFGTGLAEMSEEQWQAFREKLPMIVNVKPNAIALSRMEESGPAARVRAADDIETAAIGEELAYALPGQSSGGSAAPATFPLASAVDVSKALTFPPIGNQGSINSCVAWSMCYYQMTNNNCVVRGLDAKTSAGAAINRNIMSPRFIYPLINGGKNAATYYDEACAAIMSYGCPSVYTHAATMTADNIKEWCTEPNVWNSAMYNKPQKISFGFIDTASTVTAETKGVVDLKKILSNGYVVTIPTYVDSFNYTQNTTGRVWGCRYVSNTARGGHAMTVVGYDDNFWVDVNGNGRKDDGETGAFKIANSWGANVAQYTGGYIWIPYDALGSVSGVAGASAARIPVFSYYYFIEPQKEYTPLLVANVTMRTNKRDQVALRIGVSDADGTEPEECISVVNYYNIAFNTAANGLVKRDVTLLDKNFSGNNGSQTVTIPFDLTPVIKAAYDETGLRANTAVKLYVELTDGVDNGSSVMLGNVEIVEPITGKKAACADSSFLTANNSSVTKTVEFQITPFVGHSKTQDIIMDFNSNLRADSLNGQIFLKTPAGEIIFPEYDMIAGNRVQIYAPEETDGYVDDVAYELHVAPQVQSLGGTAYPVKKVIYMYILDDYYVYW